MQLFVSVLKRVRFKLLKVLIQSISLVYRFQYAIGHPWIYFMFSQLNFTTRIGKHLL